MIGDTFSVSSPKNRTKDTNQNCSQWVCSIPTPEQRSRGKSMRFGEAINKAYEGKKIARHGWNGRGMYVYLTEGRGIPTDEWVARMPSQEITEAEKKMGCVIIKPHLDMMNAQGERIIGWSASQTDMLAVDWYVVGE